VCGSKPIYFGVCVCACVRACAHIVVVVCSCVRILFIMTLLRLPTGMSHDLGDMGPNTKSLFSVGL